MLVDVIAVLLSGLLEISENGMFGETESVDDVTTVEDTAKGVEGVAKNVVDCVLLLPDTSDLALTVLRVKKSAAFELLTTALVKVLVALKDSVDEMLSSLDGPTRDVGSTLLEIPEEVKTSIDDGISEELVITLLTINSLLIVI